MGPIIEAIDAGHYVDSQTRECRVCGTKMPCKALLAARKAQRAYAETLRLGNRMVVADVTRL